MFDFIEAAEFRESLESDYSDMRRCAKAGAWKSVHVLAGSIVEALLVDYLVATEGTRSGGKDPLRLDLAEAISICKSEGLLNDRTADLSTVVRLYRNLIHPGRVLRLREEAATVSSGVIAIKLVDMITAQVEARRKQAFGLTVEQLLSKLERDGDSIAILKHLLADVNQSQRARFLLEVLPPRYLELKRQESADDIFSTLSMTVDRLEQAYRFVLGSVDAATKQRAAERFVRVLRDEDGDTIRLIREAFFRPEDLPMVAENQRELVKEHLLASHNSYSSTHAADAMADLARYLQKPDVRPWLDAYIRTLVSPNTSDFLRNGVRKALIQGIAFIPSELESIVDGRIAGWLAHFEARNESESAEYIRDLSLEVRKVRDLF